MNQMKNELDNHLTSLRSDLQSFIENAKTTDTSTGEDALTRLKNEINRMKEAMTGCMDDLNSIKYSMVR